MRLATTQTGVTVYFDDGWLVSFQKDRTRQAYEYSGHCHPGVEEDPEMAAAKVTQAKRCLLRQQFAIVA